MKKINKRIILSIIIIGLAIIGVVTKNSDILEYLSDSFDINLKVREKNTNTVTEINTNEFQSYKVIRVVDGDTFIIDFNGKEERVRMIGIDTPESVHPNKEKNTKDGIKISDYTKTRLKNKTVKLEFDVQQRDKYGRLLAYVYVEDKMYNEELLELGYAKIATYPPNVKYVDNFKQIQKNARENKVGLWK